jgi:hypothetical protein
MSRIAVETRIVSTRGTTPLYKPEAEGLRVIDVIRGAPAPADLGECVRVVDEHGDPLRVLVLRSAPLAPGSRVSVAPVALVYPRPGDSPILIGSPLADTHAPRFDQQLRLALERLALAGMQDYAQSAARWEGVEAASGYVQQGAVRASVVRGGRRAAAVWQRPELIRGDSAETQIDRLPARFQDFIRELLVPDERIHFFAGRSERRPRFFFDGAIGEALLVVTDRQLLWIEDSHPRGADLTSWGYEARSMPLERVTVVDLTDDGLRATGEASGPPFVAEGLPPVVRPLLEQATDFARGFIQSPRPLPMRRYELAARRDPLLVPDGWPDARAIGEGLVAMLERDRGEAPRICAYVKPAHAGKDREGLLALYPTELVFASVSGVDRLRLPLHEIAWVELRRSILSSHLRIVGLHEERWPAASAAPLVPFFGALRQLIANPRRCS